jgi:ABC-2 type transport system permease protein
MFFLLKAQYADPAGATGTAGVFAWVPPAWPGVAMAAAGQGQTSVALAWLGGSVVVIGLEVWLWTLIIARAMLAQDSSTIRSRGQTDPFARFAKWLPGNRRGAVAALELRLLWREPARLPGVIVTTLVFGGIFTVVAAALFDLGGPGMAVFGVCSVSFIVVGRRLNEIGLHSSALWTNVVARGRASDDLIGRDLGSVLVDVPILLTALAVIAIYRAELTYVLPALIFGLASLAAAYAGMRVFNVKLAQGEPRSKDTATGPNRPNPFLNAIALATWIVSTATVFALAALPAAQGAGWLYLTVPAAIVYAAGAWYASLRWIGRWLDLHQAELLIRIEKV